MKFITDTRRTHQVIYLRFPVFWVCEYQMKVITDTRRTHQVRYLRYPVFCVCEYQVTVITLVLTQLKDRKT
jgi:hypothetical protein